MKKHDMSINELMELVCENLPDDWEIVISMRAGECGISLIDPHGEDVDICDDDLSTTEMVKARIDHARENDGLYPVQETESIPHGII